MDGCRQTCMYAWMDMGNGYKPFNSISTVEIVPVATESSSFVVSSC